MDTDGTVQPLTFQLGGGRANSHRIACLIGQAFLARSLHFLVDRLCMCANLLSHVGSNAILVPHILFSPPLNQRPGYITIWR